MILIFRDGFRIELQRIGDFDGISSMCTQKQFCVIKIIKIIDRISGTEFDSFDLLQIDKNTFCIVGVCPPNLKRLNVSFKDSPNSPLNMDGMDELSTL